MEECRAVVTFDDRHRSVSLEHPSQRSKCLNREFELLQHEADEDVIERCVGVPKIEDVTLFKLDVGDPPIRSALGRGCTSSKRKPFSVGPFAWRSSSRRTASSTSGVSPTVIRHSRRHRAGLGVARCSAPCGTQSATHEKFSTYAEPPAADQKQSLDSSPTLPSTHFECVPFRYLSDSGRVSRAPQRAITSIAGVSPGESTRARPGSGARYRVGTCPAGPHP